MAGNPSFGIGRIASEECVNSDWPMIFGDNSFALSNRVCEPSVFEKIRVPVVPPVSNAPPPATMHPSGRWSTWLDLMGSTKIRDNRWVVGVSGFGVA